METAKGLVNSASKMVFGETQPQNQTEGVEPVSGQTGEGTLDTPHDLGNTTGEPTNTESSATSAGESLDPANTEGSREPKTTATSSTGPSLGAAAPESGAQEFQKQQGADRPQEVPGGAQTDAVVNEKKEAETAMSADTSGAGTSGGDAVSTGDTTSGAGPTSGGDATSGGDTTSGGGPIAGGDAASGAGGQEQSQGGQKESLGSTSKEPGTGTKYEKSTGLAAEGGDFDATRPGAGKEADRLLEEKGIHHEGNQGPPAEIPGATGGDSSSGKPSIGQKIKDKLHIGKKD